MYFNNIEELSKSCSPQGQPITICQETIESKKKGKRTYSNSVGNHSKFPQQLKKGQHMQNKDEIFSSATKCTVKEAIDDITKNSPCCPRGGLTGCFMKFFNSDYNAAAERFIACRELTRLKTPQQLDLFVQEQFRASIAGETICHDGITRYKMEYKLPQFKSMRQKESLIVCRKVFASAFGISTKVLESCSRALKPADSGRVQSFSVKKFKDDTILDYNYLETQHIFESSLVDATGTHLSGAGTIGMQLF